MAEQLGQGIGTAVSNAVNWALDLWKRDEVPPDVLQRANVPPYREFREVGIQPVAPPEPRLWEQQAIVSREITEQPTLQKILEVGKPLEQLAARPGRERGYIPTWEQAEQAWGKAATFIPRGGLTPPWEKPAREMMGLPTEAMPYEEYKTKYPSEAMVAEATLPFYFMWPETKTTKAAQFVAEALQKGTAWDDIVRGLSKFKVKNVDEFVSKVAKSLNEQLAARAPRAAAAAPRVPENIVTKLTRLIKAAKPVRKETEALYKAERAKRVAPAARVMEAGEGREAFFRAKGALKGEMPKAAFEPPEMALADTEVTELFNMVNRSDKDFFVRLNTNEGLQKLLTGQIPQQKELQLLEEMFGPELVAAILKKRPWSQRAWEFALDLANLPKAMLASWDISGLLRQGGVLFWRNPARGLKSVGPMFKALASEKNAQIVDDVIKATPHYDIAVQSKLYIAPLRGPGVRIAAREESFMTRFAKYIPGISHSERAYVTVLNKLRMDTFSSVITKWGRAGVELTDDLTRALATYINYASGRGSLGRLNQAVPLLNTLLFSPRLQASRLQLPLLLLKSPAPVRKEMIKALVAFVGANTSLLAIGVLGGGTVELDPRSSDFGKLKIGNTRLDPWTGFQQWLRFITQFVSGQRKTTTTGGIKPINRESTAIRMLRSKESPILGLLHDMMVGRSFIGEELELSAAGISEQAYNRLTPLVIQDFIDAIEEDGWIGGLTVIPALAGWGAVTYPDTLAVLETQLGQADPEDPEAGIYTTSGFAGDIRRRGYTEGQYGSPLIQFFFESEKMQGRYYDTPTDKRFDFRAKNPKIEANLFFWGRLEVLRNPKSERYVRSWMREYGIPENAIRGFAREAPTTEPARERWPAPPTTTTQPAGRERWPAPPK